MVKNWSKIQTSKGPACTVTLRVTSHGHGHGPADSMSHGHGHGHGPADSMSHGHGHGHGPADSMSPEYLQNIVYVTSIRDRYRDRRCMYVYMYMYI